ncbi:hypothetical protein [Psychrobacillus psychrotolerans]
MEKNSYPEKQGINSRDKMEAIEIIEIESDELTDFEALAMCSDTTPTT